MTPDQIAITFFLVFVLLFVCGFIVAMDGWAALGHIILWFAVLVVAAAFVTGIIYAGSMVL